MAPPLPRSKFSRAIIQKAREWKTIVDELPLLEEFDSLEDAISSSQRRLDAAQRVETETKKRIEELQETEANLSAAVREEQSNLDTLQKKLAASEDASRAAAAAEADRTLAAAREEASRVLQDAQRTAQEVAAAGRQAVDDYRASLATEITSREARVAELKDEESRLVAAHASAQSALEGLKSQLGVH